MKVGLFIPCYVNTIYPEVAVATYRLLDYFGIEVVYPTNQTCCGQPIANSGFEKDVVSLIKSFNKQFNEFDYVVAPSGSCVSFVKKNYQHILSSINMVESEKVKYKIYDICEFLHDVLKIDKLPGSFPYKVSIHNSCHGLRELHLGAPSELNIKPYSKIRSLLNLIKNIEVLEPDKRDECCGFGGMFSIEESSVSVSMGCSKVKDHMKTGASYIVGADSSCLMHLNGIIEKQKLPIQTLHIVQILSLGL